MAKKTTVLFICGSMNQTTQLHAVRKELGDEVVARFSPYYGGRVLDWAREQGLIELSIGGNRAWARVAEYCGANHLDLDAGGKLGPYDLVVTCTDMVVPPNIQPSRCVMVQEGILDPEGLVYEVVTRLGFLPRWLAGTATTGQSGAFARFCVASPGYRDHFVSRGVPAGRIVVTGIPNFDDCERFRKNAFPHRGFVLVCTSDARETFKRDDRIGFLESARRIARGRPVIVKLHPNEDAERARREIARILPDAVVFDRGSAEEMIANSDVLVCQYSSTAFVGLALGKEVHSYWDTDELRRLLPLQNRSAAKNIAAVCRGVLSSSSPTRGAAPAPKPSPLSLEPAA